MSNPILEKAIYEQLEQLHPEKQRQVLEFAKSLATSDRRGSPGSTLLRFAGAIDPDDLNTMTREIIEGCEQVNYNEW